MQALHPWQKWGPKRMNESAAEFDRMDLDWEKPVRYRDVEAASRLEDPSGLKEAGQRLIDMIQHFDEKGTIERLAFELRILGCAHETGSLVAEARQRLPRRCDVIGKDVDENK